MRTKFNNLTLALIITSSALLAACGGGDGGVASSSSASTAVDTSKPVTASLFSSATTGVTSADYSRTTTSSTSSSFPTQYHYNNTDKQTTANTGFKTALGSESLLVLLNYIDSNNSYLSKIPTNARSMFLLDGVNRLVQGSQSGISINGTSKTIRIPYTISSSSNTSFLDSPSWYSSTTANATFTGAGVKVTIVDGEINPSDSAFSTTPTKIDIGSTSSADDLGKGTSHGTSVAKIIAGKRLDGSNYGIAPKVTLSYITLKTDSQDYKSIYDKAATAGAIINSSLNIPSPSSNIMTIENGAIKFNETTTTASVGSSSTGTKSLDQLKKETALYGIAESLKAKTANASTSPLYVFAAGNIDNLSFSDSISKTESGSTSTSDDTKTTNTSTQKLADLYYNALKTKSSSSSSDSSSSSTAKTAAELGYDVNKIYTSDFGYQLRSKDALGLLVQDNDIADNMIVVTGVLASKTEDAVSVRQTALNTAKSALSSSSSNGSTDVSLQSADNSTVTRATNVALKNTYNPSGSTSTTSSSSITFYNDYFQYINTHYSAVQCGVTKYSCVSAINAVNQSVGTSFAAPQVTAIAALVKQQYPWMTSKQIKTTILTTATDLGEEGVDEVYGWGLVNAAKAVTGPNGFVFGDFEASLGSNSKSYFFNNNIFGDGGLKVSGGSSDYLYLLGKNTYTGNTVVDSANLVVVPGSWYGSNTVTQAALAGDLYVNHGGKAYLLNASTKNVTNNGLLYLSNAYINGGLTNKSNATLALDAEYGSTVTGAADIKGNALIVTKGKYTLNGTTAFNVLKFTNSGVASSNITLSKVSFSDSALVSGKATLQTSGSSKVLQVTVSSGTVQGATASLASTSLDSENLATGATALDSIIYTADQEATASQATTATEVATTSATRTDVTLTDVTLAASDETVSEEVNSPVVTPTTKAQELAAALQALDKSTLAAAAYASSASVFADIQQAARLNFAQESNAFSHQVGLAQLLERPSSENYYVYSNVTFGAQKLTADSVVKGNLNQHNLTIGAYTFSGNQSYGVALQLGSSSFNSHYQNSWLANAKTKQYGLIFNFNQLLTDDLNLAASLGVAQSKHEVTRGTLLSNNLTSEFKQTQVDLSLGVNYRLWSNQNASLVVSPAVEFSSSNQQAFIETATDDFGELLSKQALAKTTQNAFANLGLTYVHKFSLAGLDSVLDLQLKAQQALSNNKFKLNFIDDTTSGQVFSPEFLVNLTSGLTVQVTDNLRVRLAGSYQKSSNWKNREANLSFVVKF